MLTLLPFATTDSVPYLLLFQINRLHLLLTVKESATDIPINLEARRRIAFFTNSLFMDMPRAPRVRKMLSFRSGLYFMQALSELCLYNLIPITINLLEVPSC